MLSKRPLLALLVMTTLAACNEATSIEGTNGITPALVGTWNATSVEFTNVANPSEKVDLIAEGGSVRLVIQASGSYTLTLGFPGEPDETEQGAVEIEGNRFTLAGSNPDDDNVFNYTLVNNTLTLTANDESFDFDDNGDDEPASLRVVLVKQ